MAGQSSLIRVEALDKTFGHGEAAVRALAGVNLSIQAGEVVGLRGPSGSGKSILLNIVACIQAPSAGRLWLGNDLVWDGGYRIGDLRRLRRERIGFIFQFHNLLPFLNAIDNVALAMTLAGVETSEARSRVARLAPGRPSRHRPPVAPIGWRGTTRCDRSRPGQPTSGDTCRRTCPPSAPMAQI